MAWYNEVNQDGSDDPDDGEKPEPVVANDAGGSFGAGDGVPPWVQAESLPEAGIEPVTSPPVSRPRPPSMPPAAPDAVPAPPAPSTAPEPVARTSTPSPTPPPEPPPTPRPPARSAPRVVTYGQPVPVAPPAASEPPIPAPTRPPATAATPAALATLAPPDAPAAPTGPNYLSPHPTTEMEAGGNDQPSPASDITGPMSTGTPAPRPPAGPLSFNASAWEYLGVGILNLLLFFVPIFGWAGQWLIMNRFIIEHLRVEDRPLKFTMTYGYALKIILRHLLLVIFTLGLGIFWLVVKEIQAVYAHAAYADEVGQ